MSAGEDFIGFLRDHIRSVWGVELLLLLKRDPERSWPVPELVRELRGSQRLVEQNLQNFERSGLAVHEEGTWRYAPAGEALRELSDMLERAYRERPVAIINAISRPRDPLQSLADAFKFKGGDR